jgi:chorismate dehydratase
MTYRLGSVPYLNALPLTWGLHEHPEVALTHAPPSELVEALKAGRIDAGLIPAAAYPKLAGVRIVSGPAIACRGAVESVLLYHRKPLGEVGAVLADAESVSSTALLRVLLKAHLRSPAGVRMASFGDTVPSEAEAFLVIGDRALRWEPQGYTKIDLGKEWLAYSGFPFVFAVWMARGQDRKLDAVLQKAKSEGLARLEEIARSGAAERGLDPDRCLRYLRDRIRYELGHEEMQGMTQFLQKLAQLGVEV